MFLLSGASYKNKMEKIRFGVLGAASIALNRFIPALKECESVEYAGTASREYEKSVEVAEKFGGQVYDSYEMLLKDQEINAVYVPLPPALHYYWTKQALKYNKHVMVEKPFSVALAETKEIIDIARGHELALGENYMFLYHNQLSALKLLIDSRIIGETRLISIKFGFPKRGQSDFRYNNELGGGALLDCGGYTLRLATELLGPNIRIMHASNNTDYQSGVDLYGFAVVQNDRGDIANLSYGMDNDYKCQVEIWGSKGTIMATRIFTAPSIYKAPIQVIINGEVFSEKFYQDNQFKNSIIHFCNCINNKQKRLKEYETIERQAQLMWECRTF